MKQITYISLLFFIAFLHSCSGKQVQFDDWNTFQTYLNNPDNGFVLKQETNGLVYEAKITPPTSESKNELTINLRINRENGKAVLNENQFSQDEVMQIENYLSFQATDDIVLSGANFQTSPAFVHYERNYRLKPSIDIIIDFSGIEQGKNYLFKFYDRAFSQETIEFQINQELLSVCHVEKT